MIYVGGFDQYMRRCEEQAAAGYEGFAFDEGRHDARL
jgi:hypothetical protein